MAGHQLDESVVRAHRDSTASVQLDGRRGREFREEREAALLVPGATLARGAGNRTVEEEPDPERTCFERDRDRIVHSNAFRRLAGKTQVVVHPADHERTRLTHALEVAQVATSIARGIGVNVSLTEAIALGHDCGHGPGGHASEDAFDPYIAEGYDHGPWGANVVLQPLNLCLETLDGIRNHSWSRPAPSTVEGEIVSWADRIAYCAHDLEDAIRAGIVTESDIPASLADVCGRTRRDQLRTFVHAVVDAVESTGQVGMADGPAQALAGLRAFNYERIYTR
ncbi:MAG: HD domain-containing protein, partial [Propionibacteriaceae bacterium]|nr:HD domain-containing protein [Propionibacteriaceae bacterium]